MQYFNDLKGKRRLINISNMTPEQAEDYYLQFHQEQKVKKAQKTRNLKKRIKGLMQEKEVHEWILAIHSKDGKLIGKMEVYSADSEIASLKIEIPNEVWNFQYGVEAIKQFKKICEENQLFKLLELEDNEITKRYMKAYSLKTRYIEIKIA